MYDYVNRTKILIFIINLIKEDKEWHYGSLNVNILFLNLNPVIKLNNHAPCRLTYKYINVISYWPVHTTN
jgi:hypothetical protein